MPENGNNIWDTLLLAVFVADTREFCEQFVNFDTLYWDGTGSGMYKLPKGKVLVLLLKSNCDFVWTTIRRWTPQKETYYRSIVGQQVEIVINSLPSEV